MQPKANAVKTPASTHRLLRTGNVPGMEQSKKDTLLLTGEENLVDAPENNLLTELIWAWTSKPTTLCHLLKIIVPINIPN